MWGENSEREEKDSSSIITEWQNLKLFATSANSYLQSNQGLFCLWQYSTVTKKAADGKSGLKLPDLKRCRDTRHRALLGKAGIRGWSKVGPANRFKITFRARGCGCTPCCSKQPCNACKWSTWVAAYVVQKVGSTLCMWCPGWSFAFAKVRRGGVTAFNLHSAARTKSLK